MRCGNLCLAGQDLSGLFQTLLQGGVHIAARSGFRLYRVLDCSEAVAHVLRQLIAVHTAARQLAHRRVTHLLLHVFNRALNGLRRHACAFVVTHLGRRREVDQCIAQPIERLTQFLCRGVKVRFQIACGHVRLVRQIHNALAEYLLTICFESHKNYLLNSHGVLM